MLKKMTLSLPFLPVFLLSAFVVHAGPFGKGLCGSAEFECIRVERGDTWQSLFPDIDERMIVKKLNRINIRLKLGSVLAIPARLGSATELQFAPFPQKIAPSSSNSIRVDLSDLAWGAYSANGDLVKWGAMSGGRAQCPDSPSSCKTVLGTYTVYNRKGPDCKSSVYPKPTGGAPMPYCMHFYRGYALHASAAVPGYNASHGCVRLFLEDARWLNQEFVIIGSTRVTIVQ